MRAKDTARCPNCRRLQARVAALEAELDALKKVVAQLSQKLAAARKDSSTSSKPPRPTSSNRPSRHRPRVRNDVTQADNRGIPSTSVPPSRLNRSTAGFSIIASTPALRAARTCGPR